MNYNTEIYKKSNECYLAVCPDLDLFSYGKSRDESKKRLDKIIDFYLKSLDELGIPLDDVQDEQLPQTPVPVGMFPCSTYDASSPLH